MPESKLPELRVREKEILNRINDLVLDYLPKKKGIKYRTLLGNYTDQLVTVRDRISTLGRKHNLLEITVIYQELFQGNISKATYGIIYLTDVSLDDAKAIMEDFHPGLKIDSIRDIALKIVLPSRY